MADLFGQTHRAATFSRGDQNRLTLERWWAAGPHVCFIGLKPSTADHRIDDPTVRRWTSFASSWGYAGFVAVNLYPFRTSDPRECRRWADWQVNGPDWYARDDIQHNVSVIAREAKRAALVVACWGRVEWGLAHDLLVDLVLEEITSTVEPWPDVHALRLSPSGHPMHPMARGRSRIPDGVEPVLWHQGASN